MNDDKETLCKKAFQSIKEDFLISGARAMWNYNLNQSVLGKIPSVKRKTRDNMDVLTTLVLPKHQQNFGTMERSCLPFIDDEELSDYKGLLNRLSDFINDL